jgi:hypothetical protein
MTIRWMPMLLLMMVLSWGSSFAQSPSTGSGKLFLSERTPSQVLRQRITKIFGEASAIVVKFTPLDTVESINYSREFADTHWKYLFSQKCVYRCNGDANKIRTRLSAGRLLSGPCPAPFSIVIEFQAEDRSMSKEVFVNGTGQCFSLDNRSYYLDRSESILELVQRTLEDFN